MLYATTYASPVGKLTIASEGKHLIGLWIENQKYFMSGISGHIVTRDDLDIFCRTKNWLDRYFAGERPLPYELPLAPAGSVFRQAVWEYLCDIPYGHVTSYGTIAKKIAVLFERESMSAQAVGGAVGHNPISIVIPCHRVIGANGSLTGYAGGMEKKIQLLQLEGVDREGLFIPSK